MLSSRPITIRKGQTAGTYVIPQKALNKIPPHLLALLPRSRPQIYKGYHQRAASPTSVLDPLDTSTTLSRIRSQSSDSTTIVDTRSIPPLRTTVRSRTPSVAPSRSSVSTASTRTPTTLIYNEITKKERTWRKIRTVAKDINYALTYDGKKDKSTKKVSVVTRVAAIAIPFIELLVPQFKIVTSSYKTIYSLAQKVGFAPKAKYVSKETKTDFIESPITRGIIGVGVAVAGYFGSRIAIGIFGALKLGLDAIDLRNSIHEYGFTREAVLIMLKMAGTVAYIALSIFDSNLCLIFTITTKLSENFFTAYCEFSQGRIPEGIAAIVFGAVCNNMPQAYRNSINQ